MTSSAIEAQPLTDNVSGVKLAHDLLSEHIICYILNDQNISSSYSKTNIFYGIYFILDRYIERHIELV